MTKKFPEFMMQEYTLKIQIKSRFEYKNVRKLLEKIFMKNNIIVQKNKNHYSPNKPSRCACIDPISPCSADNSMKNDISSNPSIGIVNNGDNDVNPC